MLLTKLLGADVPAGVRALLEKHDIARPAPGADDEAELKHAVYWLLKMAETTHRRSIEPPPAVAPALLARFEEKIARRPKRADQHGQLHIDAPSTLRRAAIAREHLTQHPGSVLAVGDDDAVTLALWLMGARDLFAVDVDERILAFLRGASDGAIQTARADVFDDAVPESLRHGCTVVLTDPIREMDATIAFLLFGAAAMKRDGSARMFWADHPDWNFEHGQVVEAIGRAGLSIAEVHEDLHRYPLDRGLFGDLDDMSSEVGIDAAWLKKLVTATSAWSHLYALERA